MDWENVRQKFMERVAGWVPRTQKEAIKGFKELEDVLQKIHPKAIHQPKILATMDHKVYIFQFRKDLEPHVSAKGLQMLELVRSIVKTAINFDYVEKDADFMSFQKRDVTWCFCKWLSANDWKNIKPDYNNQSRIDVFAEKENRVMAAASIGSVWKFIDRHVRGEEEWDPQLWTEVKYFKSRLGSVLLLLMEEINKSKSVLPVILIPDDTSTLEIFNNYFSYVRKLGITVYKVRSKEHVTEMY